MNRVLLVGNLTRDPEYTVLQSGAAVMNFPVAVNERIKRGDQWEDYASFFDCVIFGKRAEGLRSILHKGFRVGVDGSLRQERWEKDGEKRQRVKVYVANIDLLTPKGGSKPAVPYGDEPGDLGYSGGEPDESVF
jgi:single-strand DNA-binding protein